MHKSRSKKIKTNWLLEKIEPGILVRPLKQIHLTPPGDHEINDWPEWKPTQIGIVIPYPGLDTGICVLTPNGCGFCFTDEVLILS